MNNRKTDQILRLSRFDDTELEEISRRFPALDRSEINEIAALCEERLNMNEKNELYENHDPDTVDTVEVRKKTALFRHPAFTAAASFIILIGMAGAVIAGISRKNNGETSMSAIEPPAAVTQITTDPEENPVVTTGSEITTQSAENTSQKKTQTTAKVTEKAVSSVTTTGIVSDPKAGSVPTTERAEPQPTEDIDSPEEPPVEDVTEPVPADPGVDKTYYMEKAKELREALFIIDQLKGRKIGFDMNDTFTAENGDIWAKVDDERFQCTDDIRDLMESSMTAELIDKTYSRLIGTDKPYYADIDGVLYGNLTVNAEKDAKATNYSWVDDEVVSVHEHIYETDTEYSVFTQAYYTTRFQWRMLGIALENDIWKLNSDQCVMITPAPDYSNKNK